MLEPGSPFRPYHIVSILFLVMLLLPLLLPYAHSQFVERVSLDAAMLNGQNLSISNPELRVSPGTRIIGTVTITVEIIYYAITVENVESRDSTFPSISFIWVTSWERGTVSNGRVRVIADDIRFTRQFTVNIDVTAPSSPGIYYIGFFAAPMNPDEVASNDRPPNYGDGDDVWDMPAQGWEEVISNGQASTGPYRIPGRAIRIIVQQQQTTIVDVWTNKGGRGVGNLDGGQYTVGESITLYCETAGATLLRMVLIRPDGSSVEVLKLSNVQAGTYSVSGTVGEPTGVWIASCIEQHGERDPVALLWDDVRFTVQQRATATVTVYTTTTRTVTSTLHATATTETTVYTTVYQTTSSTSTRTWYTTVTRTVTTTVISWTTVTTTVLG
jgi:hypothetical protein